MIPMTNHLENIQMQANDCCDVHKRQRPGNYYIHVTAIPTCWVKLTQIGVEVSITDEPLPGMFSSWE